MRRPTTDWRWFLHAALLLQLSFGWTTNLLAQNKVAPAASISAADRPAGDQQEIVKDQGSASGESAIPPALTEYRGRKIAVTMSYHGAPWLVRQEREEEERCSLLLANLGLRRGMTVCDLGCGNGFHTFQLAQLIGDKGRVLAVDIQPEMLNLLRETAERKGIENVTPILGSVHDPRLPEGSVDLILLVDVYHEFSHPEQMLARMRAALKPDGRIALVEFRSEDDSVPIKPEHKMSKQQILQEFPPNGFKLVEEFDKLPWQHLMFFSKDEQVSTPNQ